MNVIFSPVNVGYLFMDAESTLMCFSLVECGRSYSSSMSCAWTGVVILLVLEFSVMVFGIPRWELTLINGFLATKVGG